jgi:putative tryptophan/tyrosine transport system substrate-binding protein
MRRRSAIIAGLAALLFSSERALADATGTKIPRVGFLSPQPPTLESGAGFREGLNELGYVEGQNIQIEYRWEQGRFDRLADYAKELVQLNVDVIVTVVTQASLAAQAATHTIPIVMIGVADPVGVGLVASLARPGGSITGTSGMAAEIVGKQFELLREVVPQDLRIAVLWNPANAAFQALQVTQVEIAARAFGVQLQLVEARTPDAFEAAFSTISREGTRALHILGDPLFSLHSASLVELAAKNRLATITDYRLFAEAGGLMAYGPSYFDLSKRAAAYVDKILKGAKPEDLPVEQPTRFELIVNLKTAKALSVTILGIFSRSPTRRSNKK